MTRSKNLLIRGKRVYLRFVGDEDQQEFVDLCRNSKKLHRPWVIPPQSQAAFLKYMARFKAGSYLHVACEHKTHRIVAAVNLHSVVRDVRQTAALGYFGFSEFARQGLVSEAVALCVSLAFRRYKLHRVEANVQADNVCSLAFVRKMGFRHEGFSPGLVKQAGRWCDYHRFALCREEWRGFHAKK